MTTTINLPSIDEDRAPVYCSDGYGQIGRGYIDLDSSGYVSIGCTTETSSCPASVWHDVTLRWYIDAQHSDVSLDALLKSLAPLLERVHAGHSIEWDGSNSVGRLTDDGKAASEEIEEVIDRFESDLYLGVYPTVVQGTAWVGESLPEVIRDYRAAESREAFIADATAAADRDGYILVEMESLCDDLDETIADDDAEHAEAIETGTSYSVRRYKLGADPAGATTEPVGDLKEVLVWVARLHPDTPWEAEIAECATEKTALAEIASKCGEWRAESWEFVAEGGA